MAKGVKKDAFANSGTANQYSSAANTNSTSLYNQLNPIYTAEATNPQGYSPEDLSAMNTASQQSLGGGQAAAAGEGSLAAARTRNAGGFAPAIAESAREAMRRNSQNAVTIQGQNANLKEAQRQSGIAGLSGLYDTNSANALKALGLSNDALNVANGADRNLFGLYGDVMKTATTLANPWNQAFAQNAAGSGSGGSGSKG